MKKIIFVLTLLSIIGVADFASACMPAYTLTSTYNIQQAGNRNLTVRVGGGLHESSRIVVRAYKNPKNLVPTTVGTNILRVSRVVRTDDSAVNYIEFEAVGRGTTVIKVPLQDGTVVDQSVTVEVMPSPRGC